MKITGVLINYFIHCPRQAWLFANNIKSEHTNENVKIGKILHNLKYEDREFSEVEILDEGIKMDKLNFKNKIVEIEELKKSNLEIRGQVFQVLYYMEKLKEKGVKSIGKLIFSEKKKLDIKSIEDIDFKIEGFKLFILDTENNFKLLDDILEQIRKLEDIKIPQKLYSKTGKPHKKCKGCSYFEFCWI